MPPSADTPEPPPVPEATQPDVVVALPRAELVRAVPELVGMERRIRARLAGTDERAPDDLPIELRAYRRPFGWSLHARAHVPPSDFGRAAFVVDHVLVDETLSEDYLTRLTETREALTGHACEHDPRFTYLRPAFEEAFVRIRKPGRRRRASLRALNALDRSRLDALDAAEASLSRLPQSIRALRAIPTNLHGPLLAALVRDSSGRLAELAHARPHTARALGLALGDRYDAWVRDGELAAPLRLVVQGRKDADVLAAALETGRGLEPTDARISRLRALASRACECCDRPYYLIAQLDTECEPSWLPRRGIDVEHWAMALAWGEMRGLSDAARRYVLRYASRIGSFVSDGDAESLSTVMDAIRADIETLLRMRVPPGAITRRALRAAIPCPEGLLDRAESEGATATRVQSGREFRRFGLRFEHRPSNVPFDEVRSPVNEPRAYYVVECDGASYAAQLTKVEGAWEIDEVRGPRNQRPRAKDLVRALAVLERAAGRDR